MGLDLLENYGMKVHVCYSQSAGGRWWEQLRASSDMPEQHAAGPAPATGSPGKIHSAHCIHLVLDKGSLNGRTPK